MLSQNQNWDHFIIMFAVGNRTRNLEFKIKLGIASRYLGSITDQNAGFSLSVSTAKTLFERWLVGSGGGGL